MERVLNCSPNHLPPVWGRGVIALFLGPTGTGKTMAAIATAPCLGIELFHIEVSRMVSKNIGDTEKYIDRVFTHDQRPGGPS